MRLLWKGLRDGKYDTADATRVVLATRGLRGNKGDMWKLLGDGLRSADRAFAEIAGARAVARRRERGGGKNA